VLSDHDIVLCKRVFKNCGTDILEIRRVCFQWKYELCDAHIILTTTGVLGFDPWLGLGIFLFTTASRTALGPTQPPILQVPEALSVGVKLPVRESDHSTPSNAEVKNSWNCTSTIPIRLHGVMLDLIKAQGQLYLYLYLLLYLCLYFIVTVHKMLYASSGRVSCCLSSGTQI
jgi:hypothetical protein